MLTHNNKRIFERFVFCAVLAISEDMLLGLPRNSCYIFAFSFSSRRVEGITEEYKHRWQMLKRGGALDAKHIRSIPLTHLRSHYYNYKQLQNIVSVISVTACYELIIVNAGKNGRNGGVFQHMWSYRDVGNIFKSSRTTVKQNEV
jgi:hypothetical protein